MTRFERLVQASLLAAALTAGSWAAAQENLVFITSASGSGDLSSWPEADGLSGLDAGDRICQNLAGMAGLPGDYIAYLSNNEDDAVCRLHGLSGKWFGDNCGLNEPLTADDSQAWHRVDGRPIFPNAADMHFPTDRMYYPLWLDENGVQHGSFILTGSSEFGAGGGASNCENYSNGSSNAGGSIGVSTRTSSNFGSGFGIPCQSTMRLACFRVDQQPAVARPDHRGIRQAFMSNDRLFGAMHLNPEADGLTGRTGADRICQNQAAAAHLKDADTYKALLPDAVEGPFERFDWPDGPWARLDGILVIDGADQFVNGGSQTSLNLTPESNYVGRQSGWSGTGSDGQPDGTHCEAWTDETVTGSGSPANQAGAMWAKSATGGGFPCGGDFPLRYLFCLADSDLLFHDDFGPW